MSKPRRGHIRVPGVIETIGEPIRNPVTGAEHRARIQMPEGVEFRIAEAGSRTTGRILLPDLENTHAQFAHIHFSNTGVVRSAIQSSPLARVRRRSCCDEDVDTASSVNGRRASPPP
jgi:hypothetical protein